MQSEKGGKGRLGAKCTCIDSLASLAPVRTYTNARIHTYVYTRAHETRIVYRYRYREWRGWGEVRRGMKCGVASRYCRRLQIKYPISLFGTSQPPVHPPPTPLLCHPFLQR